MTNTIPNVPRELMADLLGNDHDKRIMAERHLLAMLANAPSPAGVDGLDVVGYIDSDDDVSGSYAVFKNDCDLRDGTELVRLSDAQAIIDGLRGEVAALREERDSFQRIGIRQIEHRYQLAALLLEKFPRIDPRHPITLSEVDHCCEYVLHKDRERLHCAIDAALSAAK